VEKTIKIKRTTYVVIQRDVLVRPGRDGLIATLVVRRPAGANYYVVREYRTPRGIEHRLSRQQGVN
jgi:hypothetical protein